MRHHHIGEPDVVEQGHLLGPLDWQVASALIVQAQPLAAVDRHAEDPVGEGLRVAEFWVIDDAHDYARDRLAVLVDDLAAEDRDARAVNRSGHDTDLLCVGALVEECRGLMQVRSSR